MKLREGNVFTPVCHSVHRGSWLPSMHHRPYDQHPGGSAYAPAGGPHPGVGVEQTHAGTRKVGGTHSTGILSFSFINFWFVRTKFENPKCAADEGYYFSI